MVKKCSSRIILLTLILNVIVVFSVFSQRNIPLIRASSDIVDIRDGNTFKKGAWRIVPKIKLDVYETLKKNKTVTFYTDIDSISFFVKPDTLFDFIVLLNGKDTAYTQIKLGYSKYLDVLKAAGVYDFEEKNLSLEFKSVSGNTNDLKSLRSKFNLDSIAGDGNEVSKILNVLHWVHNSFPYDGSKEVPIYNNTEGLMTQCIKENKTLHCGAFADILSECYMALGFESKRIVCLPADSNDFECHSINIVYSKMYNKWLWVDATNNAYIMDENNQLLGVSEVRERLINDKPLKLNSDANLNKNLLEIEEYLYNYMAKNLFALQYFEENKAIQLLPQKYKGVIPRTRYQNPIVTHNPDIFWAKPR